MALKIRLARGGAKKRPFFSVVVADSRYPRDGRFIEKIGTYNPMLPKDAERVKIDVEKAREWYKKGARPTDRVARFLSQLDGENFSWEHGNNPNKAKPGQKAPRADLMKTLDRMIASAQSFDPGKVKAADVAAAAWMGGSED